MRPIKAFPKHGGSRIMSPRYRLFRALLRALTRLLVGFEVRGAENVPEDGPVILAANHRRYADPVLVCMAVPRRIQWMGKKELFTPPFDKFFYFIGTFPVDREGGGRGALRSSLVFLEHGWTMGIFPEGARRKAYDPDDPPKGGVAMLAARSGAPIVPVFMDKVPSLSERLRGGKLRAYIGKPVWVDATRKGKPSYDEVADRVLREIYSLGDAAGSDVGRPGGKDVA